MMGNEIEVGQLLHFKSPADWLVGRVVKVKAGGLATPTGIEPGIVVIQLECTYTVVRPNEPTRELARVVPPGSLVIEKTPKESVQ